MAALVSVVAGKDADYISAATLHSEIADSLDRATAFMLKAESDGLWDDSAYGDNYEFGSGGRSALCIWAMLQAGQSPQLQQLNAAINDICSRDSNSVRFRSLRLLALTQGGIVGDQGTLDSISADVNWLVERCPNDGAYGAAVIDDSESSEPGEKDFTDPVDNFSSFLAHWSVLSAARFVENAGFDDGKINSGIKIPQSYFRSARRYWQGSQLADGGWSFDASGKRSYGSATAEALAVLIGSEDRLDDGRPAAVERKRQPVERALAWLAKNFSSWQNPPLGPQYYYRWALAMTLAGGEGGYTTLGGSDFRLELARRLLASQLPDGSWGQVSDTAMAIIYLAEMKVPILFGKLRYDGTWNSRRYDMAQLCRWFSSSFERRVRWRVVDVDSDLEHWRDTPVLIISGASRPKFTTDQLERLKQYILRGGLVVSIAIGDSAAFNVEMARVYKKMFDRYDLQNIDPDHPVFNAYRKLDRTLGLQCVTNGVRLLAVHCSQDISRYFQPERRAEDDTAVMLAANIYLHTTDFGAFDGSVDAIDVSDLTGDQSPTATRQGNQLAIAIVSPDGEKFCEPFALERFRHKLQADGFQATVLDAVSPRQLTGSKCDLAILTGRGDFELSEKAAEALLDYIDIGGLLVCTAAGADDDFNAAINREIYNKLLGKYDPQTRSLELNSQPLAIDGFEIDYVRYRRRANMLYSGSAELRLIGRELDGRLISIYSRDDLLASLTGFRGQNLRGYVSEDAYRLLRNLAIYAATRADAELPVLPNRVHVKWGD